LGLRPEQADAFHKVSKEIPLMVRMILEGYLGNKGAKGGIYRYKDAADSTSRQTLDFGGALRN